MGLRTVFKTAGHWFKGLIVKVDSEIQSDTITNPEIDSTGGNFIWKTKTTSANSWKLNDPGTTEDIIITDTLAKTFTLHSNYTASGFVPSFNADLDSALASITRVFAGGRTTFTVTHNLNTLDIKPEIYRLSDGRSVGWRRERTSVNTIEVSRNGNVADGLFRITI